MLHRFLRMGKWVFIIMGVAIILALAGVTLGAVNFVTPTTYPSVVLAIWLVVDVVLIAFVLVRAISYVFILGDVAPSDNAQIIGGGLVIVGFFGLLCLMFIVDGLQHHHFAWVSAWMFAFLITMIIADAFIFVKVGGHHELD